ncbi:hypothetical protein N0V88_000535 [Collariella sp. IMI 366227]|nr:hypothetical protein N0V88_000535 [Collariella sp. IMI 366227]
MARVQSPPVLSQIRVARSHSEQASALRALKDEVVGHVQRKEWWVQNGILESLVKILRDNARSPLGLNDKERSFTRQSEALSEEEVVRLLALQLIASFSYGKLAANLARRGHTFCDANLVQVEPPSSNPSIPSTSFLRFCQQYLRPDSTDAVVQEQKRVVAALISQLCKGPQHQNALADSGILDGLATMLASFIVLRGEVIPGAKLVGQADGLADLIPAPAAPGADLASTLEAISTIIAGSRFRSCLLLSSPVIMAVLPYMEFTPGCTDTRAAWNALEMHGLSSIRARNPGAMDYLLPAVPLAQTRTRPKRVDDFPPLGFSLSRNNLASGTPSSAFRFTGWDPSRSDAPTESENVEEPESPIIPWLIHLVRSTSGLERVMAASVLTSLFKAGCANPEREQALGVLIVPLLCQLMKDNDKPVPSSVQEAGSVEPDMVRSWVIMERATEVLARLIGDSKPLQQTAHEWGAIKLVAKLLKESYEPQPVQSAPRPWSPTPDRGPELEEGLATCRVGAPAFVPAYAHKIRMRESTLKLVAAMAALEKDYREALVAEDVTPYIVQSLFPRPGKPKNAKEKPGKDKGAEDGTAGGSSPYGHNPNAVIIAACHAIRTLSRLPMILRTTLQDHGVAMPINDLLRHPDPEVQIAASSVAINLVSETSSMVEAFLKADIIKTLCEQAHSLSSAALGPGRPSPTSPTTTSSDRLHHAALKLSLLRDSELNPTRKARADTLTIQEQSLGFVRNFILLPTPSSQTDMVDYLFTSLGQDRLFSLLADKLKVRVVNALSRRHHNRGGNNNNASNNGNNTLVLYPQSRLVENLVWILVHIAASSPRLRQLLVSQTELLKLLGGHIQSGDDGVRKALAQLFANLTWLESEADRSAWGVRTGELERLGFLAKLEGLGEGDEDLGVRQRARAAVAQLKGVLGA